MGSITEPLSLRAQRIGAKSHLLYLCYLWFRDLSHPR